MYQFTFTDESSRSWSSYMNICIVVHIQIHTYTCARTCAEPTQSWSYFSYTYTFKRIHSVVKSHLVQRHKLIINHAQRRRQVKWPGRFMTSGKTQVWWRCMRVFYSWWVCFRKRGPSLKVHHYQRLTSMTKHDSGGENRILWVNGKAAADFASGRSLSHGRW